MVDCIFWSVLIKIEGDLATHSLKHWFLLIDTCHIHSYFLIHRCRRQKNHVYMTKLWTGRPQQKKIVMHFYIQPISMQLFSNKIWFHNLIYKNEFLGNIRHRLWMDCGCVNMWQSFGRRPINYSPFCFSIKLCAFNSNDRFRHTQKISIYEMYALKANY